MYGVNIKFPPGRIKSMLNSFKAQPLFGKNFVGDTFILPQAILIVGNKKSFIESQSVAKMEELIQPNRKKIKIPVKN